MNDCFTALGWTPEGRRVRGRPRTVEEERKKASWRAPYAPTGTTRLHDDDDDGSGLFGNLGL